MLTWAECTGHRHRRCERLAEVARERFDRQGLRPSRARCAIRCRQRDSIYETKAHAVDDWVVEELLVASGVRHLPEDDLSLPKLCCKLFHGNRNGFVAVASEVFGHFGTAETWDEPEVPQLVVTFLTVTDII